MGYYDDGFLNASPIAYVPIGWHEH